MNTGDWLAVAALLREVAATIENEAADGLEGIHRIKTEPTKDMYRQMTLRHRRQPAGMSFRAVLISQYQIVNVMLTTEPG